MSSIGTRLAVLSATALIAGTAQAAPNLSFPRAKDPATVADWLLARTDLTLDTVVVAGPDAVFAVTPSPAPSAVPQGRRARVVQEVIDPGFVPTLGGRSPMLELDVDCAGRRVMRQAFDIYGGSNLSGEVERLGAGRSWSEAQADTPMDAIVTSVCQLGGGARPLAGLYTVAEETPVPAPPIPQPLPTPLPAAPPRSVIVETELKPPPARAPAPVQVAAVRPVPPPAATSPRPRAAPRLVTAAAPMLNLGEFPSLDAARAAWARAAAGSPGKVQRIELASGGGVLMYRALVDGYASAPEAEAACAAVKAGGGVCSLR